ncbi:MAG TPA: hypothetical protein DCE28_06600, partial [Halomonas sp.]
TLQFKIYAVLTCHSKVTEANQTWLKVQTNSFKTDNKERVFIIFLLESLALIFGDLSPPSASAHMNYLIKLLKSCFAVVITLKEKQPGGR